MNLYLAIQTSGSHLKGHVNNLQKKKKKELDLSSFLQYSIGKESSCMCTLYLLMTIELLTGRAVSMCDNE